MMAIVTYYLERSEDQKEASKYMRLSVSTDQINAILIERNLDESSETLDVKRTSEGWVFTKDMMPADLEYMKDLSELIESADFEAVILAPNQSPDQFRFNKPKARITIQDNLSRPNTIIMSDRRNFQGQPYYMLNDDKNIYTLNSDLDKKIMNKIIFFQAKHVFKNQNEEFTKIQVQSLNHKFDVLKIPNLDKTKVAALVSQLKKLTVQSYLGSDSKKKLVSPVMEVIMSAPNLIWTLRLSLNLEDKKLYGEAKISGLENKTYFVEYDTSYWAYFSNLNEKQFVKDQK
ncbi:MAG: DUF4340 domain-containing protein [Moraxellaceae bacterium]|nr:DUF4340 domain-containing protein [Pseudobdellovibrionaceae bacterium]